MAGRQPVPPPPCCRGRKAQFKGSRCLRNRLLDAVYNLQINSLAPAKVLILSQHRATQAALGRPVNSLRPRVHRLMALPTSYAAPGSD